jgi:V/A-type H+-transporting ATPase subunit K
MAALVMVLAIAGAAGAQEATAEAKPLGIGAGLLGLAAALAVGLGAIGTAWAQSRIGAAAAGAIAERPEMGGLMLVFLALPETMVILGFLVAFFVIGKI